MAHASGHICTLCEQPIHQFSAQFHELDIEGRTVRICDRCGQHIMRWQQEKIARLFPTKTLKRLRK